MLSKVFYLAFLICLTGCSNSRLDNVATSHDSYIDTYITIAQAAYKDYQ